jgi:hypothetical protein
MHAEVVKEKVSRTETDSRCRQQQEKKQGDEVRRIETANSPFPERDEANLRFLARGFAPGPLQVNAEAGDYEEEKNADVAKRARELDQANRVLKKVVGDYFLALLNGVIKDDAQSGSASQRIDATQACWGGSHLEFFLPQITQIKNPILSALICGKLFMPKPGMERQCCIF